VKNGTWTFIRVIRNVAFKFSGFREPFLGIRATCEYRELKKMKSKEKENERNLTRERGNFGFVSLSTPPLSMIQSRLPIYPNFPYFLMRVGREQKPGN